MLILESINLYAESETLTKIALTIIILVLDEGLMMKRIIDWCMEIRMKDLRSGIFMTLLSYTKAEEEKQEENIRTNGEIRQSIVLIMKITTIVLLLT